MLAEIHGKLSLDRTTPADRLEDTLTDAVLGSLRYLPRHVLGAVLCEAFDTTFSAAQLHEARLRFWPTFPDGTEPDVVVEVGGVMIIVEAKYESPFSQGQLIREWRHGRRDALARQLSGPWLLAVTAHATEPAELEDARGELANDPAFEDAGLASSSAVRWISWQRIAKRLADEGPRLALHERELVDDSGTSHGVV